MSTAPKQTTPSLNPPPAWATRALVEYVIEPMYAEMGATSQLTVLNPNCGKGHVALPLTEYFRNVHTLDDPERRKLYPTIPAMAEDYLKQDLDPGDAYHWVIVMPPRGQETEYALKALTHATHGVAVLCQVDVLQSVTRASQLFEPHPVKICMFPQRLNIKADVCNRNQKAPGQYVWLVWTPARPMTEMGAYLFPACKVDLQREGDYDDDVKPDMYEPEADTEADQDAQEPDAHDEPEHHSAADPAPDAELPAGAVAGEHAQDVSADDAAGGEQEPGV